MNLQVRKVVLHIGAGKCGSSALQEYLSKSVTHRTTSGETLAYGVLNTDGKILTGATITERALSSMFQYVTSTAFTAVENKMFGRNLLSSLQTLNCDVLVLSFEGWIYEAGDAKKHITNFGGLDIEVLMYVRAPAQWVNSAWWQWGAWSDLSFGEWLDEELSRTFWSRYIECWNELGFVTNIVVRLLPENVLEDFCDLYAIEYRPGETMSSNVSLAGSVQRFLQRHRELRPSPHISRIEFSLARHLSAGRSAWVIDPDNLSVIIEATQEYNRQLMHWLDHEQIECLKKDRSWWHAGYYDNRQVETPNERPVSNGETDALLLDAIKAIHEAEVSILALKKEIRQLKNSES